MMGLVDAMYSWFLVKRERSITSGYIRAEWPATYVSVKHPVSIFLLSEAAESTYMVINRLEDLLRGD